MKFIHQQCYSNINVECSQQAHKQVGIDFEKTKQCYKDSFDKSKDASHNYDDASVTNTLIEKEMRYFEKYGQRYIFPSVTINNMTYRGQLEIEAVMNAICAGFKKAPGVCQ